MIFNSGFLNSLLLLGAVQGLIITGLLLFGRNKNQSNRLFAFIILLLALACLNLYLGHQDWYNQLTVFRFVDALVPFLLIMAAGPLVYFYTRSMLDPAFILTKKHRIYFYPVILDIVPQLTALVYLIAILFHVTRNNLPIGRFIDTYNTYVDIPRWLSLSIYTGFSAKILYRAKTGLNRPWLKQFTGVFIAFQILWLIHLIPYLIPKYSNRLLDWADWYPLYIPLVLMIYWLGIKGFFILREEAVKKTGNALPESTLIASLPVLQKAMEDDRLYLDPNLNLTRLSAHTHLPSKTISATLNQHLGKSFNEFVNEYRVAEIRRRLLQPEIENMTIAGIAYECGFNSQPTFQRAFKSVSGVTPTEFMAKNA